MLANSSFKEGNFKEKKALNEFPVPKKGAIHF